MDLIIFEFIFKTFSGSINIKNKSSIKKQNYENPDIGFRGYTILLPHCLKWNECANTKGHNYIKNSQELTKTMYQMTHHLPKSKRKKSIIL